MVEREQLLHPQAQMELTLRLYSEGLFGIRENPDDYITLKGGERKSPHYLDLRQGLSEVSIRGLIVSTMGVLAISRANTRGAKLPKHIYDHYVGTPEAVTSYAAMLADRAEMSLLQPRVDMAKARGNKAPILGRFAHGDLVACFDDVITDGASKIETIRGLLNYGIKTADYFVVVDREEGGSPQVLAETGIEITSALPVSAMVKILEAESIITQTQYDNVAEYMTQYGDPSAKATLGLAA